VTAEDVTPCLYLDHDIDARLADALRRHRVELILDKLAAGESIEQILSAHPRLTEEGIRAALAFAAEALRADVLYPVAG
jgi:septum formation inhibitor-activating ATPase MinD